MSAADDAVQGVTSQLTKAKGEIDAEIATLQASGVSPESLAGLQSISQSLDDLNPDVVPEPAPEPTPEPVPEPEPTP
jgi:hypothetical protein